MPGQRRGLFLASAVCWNSRELCTLARTSPSHQERRESRRSGDSTLCALAETKTGLYEEEQLLRGRASYLSGFTTTQYGSCSYDTRRLLLLLMLKTSHDVHAALTNSKHPREALLHHFLQLLHISLQKTSLNQQLHTLTGIAVAIETIRQSHNEFINTV